MASRKVSIPKQQSLGISDVHAHGFKTYDVDFVSRNLLESQSSRYYYLVFFRNVLLFKFILNGDFTTAIAFENRYSSD